LQKEEEEQMRRFLSCFETLVLLTLPVINAQAVNIEWITVGDPGNVGELSGGGWMGAPRICGAVDSVYRIAEYEVTNAQYCEFLNAVARTDPNNLYNARWMDKLAAPSGGITRTGSSGNFGYTLNINMGNKPVNWVSWYDALRFCNWLHNGQPTGTQNAATTEDGAYDMSLGINPVRKPGALVFLPSEDERYKAAYYEPGASTDDNDEYWTYATRSDAEPLRAHSDNVGNIDGYYNSGNSGSWTIGEGTNVVNYDGAARWNGGFNVTTIGSAGLSNRSYYGAADMNGNVLEWIELRGGYRGGSIGASPGQLQALYRAGYTQPTEEGGEIGFRVASVPEPGSITLLVWGLLGLLGWGWRRRRTA